MSGSAPSNSQAVDFERQQAAQAQQKEADRQARLQQGQQAIDAIFNGQPVMGSRATNYDWSTFKPGGGLDPSTGQPIAASGVPSGFTAVRVPSGGGGGRGWGDEPMAPSDPSEPSGPPPGDDDIPF